MNRDCLVWFVITENPKDYPGEFIARRWEVGEKPVPCELVARGKTLGEVRAGLPHHHGLICFGRHPGASRRNGRGWRAVK